VQSQISATGDQLAGANSETTIDGSGVGQLCEGLMRETGVTGTTVTFSYDETLNPASCIAHTVIALTSAGAGRVAYYETYQTNIGPGQLIGQLTH
jgi:hypothetical protein